MRGKPKEKMVHVAFRSKETGRYLFHVMWPVSEFNEIMAASELMGLTFEEFVVKALEEYVARYPNPVEDAVSNTVE